MDVVFGALLGLVIIAVVCGVTAVALGDGVFYTSTTTETRRERH